MTILDAWAALGPQLCPPRRADQQHTQTDPQLQTNTNAVVTEPFTAPFLLSSFWQLWRESVSNQKIFVRRDRGVNSARKSFQALVTRVQAHHHCPPNPWDVLQAQKSALWGYLGSHPGETFWMEEGPHSPLGLTESYSGQLKAKAVYSPCRIN